MTKGIQETSLTPYKALHFGTLTIDPINRVVTLANTEISLSTADFELLWELATHAGQNHGPRCIAEKFTRRQL